MYKLGCHLKSFPASLSLSLSLSLSAALYLSATPPQTHCYCLLPSADPKSAPLPPSPSFRSNRFAHIFSSSLSLQARYRFFDALAPSVSLIVPGGAWGVVARNETSTLLISSRLMLRVGATSPYCLGRRDGETVGRGSRRRRWEWGDAVCTVCQSVVLIPSTGHVYSF